MPGIFKFIEMKYARGPHYNNPNAIFLASCTGHWFR